MNRLWSLYKALANVHYGWSAGKYYLVKKRKRLWEPTIIVLGLAPVIVMGLGFMWVMTEKLFIAGLGFGQPHLALVNGVLMASLMGLFFGFFYVLSAFYFSSDLAGLIPLPLRPVEILGAKLGVVLTGQYALNALVLLPIWLRYGLLAQAGLGYVLSSLLVFLIVPIIPLVLASLGTVLLMRFVNLSRHKDKLTLIGGILLLIAVFGFQFWLQSSLGSGDPDVVLDRLLNSADGLILAVGRAFPPSIWAAKAMAYAHQGSGWLNLLYFVAASFLGVGVLYLVGEKVFLQGLVAGLEASKGAGKEKKTALTEKSRSAFMTLVATEAKVFLRDPGFALNGLVGYVLLPVMAVLPTLGIKMDGNFSAMLNLDELPALLVAGGIALFFMIMSAMSMIPSTTFSREGKYLWIMRNLPLSIEQIITTRVVAAQVVNTIGCLLGLIPLAFMLRLGVGPVVWGTVLGILLATVLAYLLVLFDLRRPMLDWVNPIKAVKSNLNAMIGVFGSMGLVFLLGALLFINVKTQTLWLIPVELLGVVAVLGALIVFLIKRLAPEMWSRI